MNNSQRPDSFYPGDYLHVLRRRWWIALGLTIVGALAAVGYLKVAPKVYTSTASVYVIATGADASQVANGRTSGDVDMDSEAQVVQSVTIATAAGHMLHTTLSPTALIKDTAVTVPANSEVLQISCKQPTAKAAAACAQAFATAYLQNRSTTSNSELNAQLKTLQAQVAPLERDVADLSAKVAALPSNSADRASAQAQLSTDETQLSELNHQVGITTSDLADSSGGSIITQAQPPSKPTSPLPLLILPSGVIIGLLAGLLVAFWVDRRDRRIRSGADVRRYLDVPLLLSVPSKRRNPQPSLAVPRSRAGQMFTDLAYSTAAELGEGNHVLVVAGASLGSGASVTAASLAAALARTHSDVILVCADLSHSVTPELFGLDRGRGLAEVLSGTATIREVARRPADFARLRVITPGSAASLDLYDFQHDVNRRLIAELRTSASIIILEVQAAGASGETFSLAEFADAALVVAEVNRTKRDEVEETLQRMDRLRTPVLGAVLVPRFAALADGPQRREARSAERSTRPAGGTARPAQRHYDAGTNGTTASPERDLGETRPLPVASVRQAVGDQHGGGRSPGSEQSRPGKNAEG